MIAMLRGRVLRRGPDWVVVDVGGVGYRVAVPASTAAALPGPGEEVTLHTHTHVREDTLALYGFASEDELRLFEDLMTVSGIGPRLSLTALSTLRPAEFRRAIAEEDVASLTRISGVGRKTAQRMILELKGKLTPGPEGDAGPQAAAAFDAPESDAVAALVALGYAEADAARAVRAARAAEGEADTARLVRLALRELAPFDA